MEEITIGPYKIGPKHPPFLVAEMSANHNQSLERALAIIQAAKDSGAHAIKLQTYTPETMTLDIHEGDFVIKDPNSLWYGKSLYELYQAAYTPWEWHRILFDRCKELGLIYFSTPFDATAVDFLEELHVPCYKIASLEMIDLPLIEKVAATGKPILISTGGATYEEIQETVLTATRAGCRKILLLKCTAAYPASAAFSNLLTIPHMKESFQLPIGLSDHTLGIGAALASIAVGASLIEKHFTLSRSDGGLDAAFSIEPTEFKLLAMESKNAWESLGAKFYGPTKQEESTLALRRSLYFIRDIEPGDIINQDDVKAIRPGAGLPPKELKNVIGRTAKAKIQRGDPVRWDVIK